MNLLCLGNYIINYSIKDLEIRFLAAKLKKENMYIVMIIKFSQQYVTISVEVLRGLKLLLANADLETRNFVP